MSLRAIQKRDREKLSQRQQQQQFISHHPQLRGPGVGVAPSANVPSSTTTTSAMAMKMTAASGANLPGVLTMAAATHDVGSGAVAVPSVQSIIQSQNAKRKQRLVANGANGSDNALLPTRVVVDHHQSTLLLRRSSSYPTLSGCGGTLQPTLLLRSIKSESDLTDRRSRHRSEGRGSGHGGHGSVSRSFADGGGSGAFSTNNLYLGAKSEVCLKTLAVKNMQQHSVQLFGNGGAVPPSTAPGSIRSSSGGSSGGPPPASHQSKQRLYESRRTSELSASDFGAGSKGALQQHHKGGSHGSGGSAVRIPIVGYEVMEERARFTIFKLRIENSISHTCWLVLRRYTDFVRLNNKLRTLFPHCNLVLPRKKWFGDNFSTGFIDNRIQGLQTFIDTILGDDLMRSCQSVRDFFCLDEPPSYSESMEESRVIFEAQEETISQLKQQLQAKDDLVHALQTKLATEANRNKILTNVIRNSVENCAKCSKSIDQQLKESVYK